MAPKRKTGAAAHAPKKPKTDPNHTGVQEALEMADMPDGVRQMLIACIAPALGAPADERQPSQNTAVAMIGECIDGVKAKLQQAVDAESAKTRELEGAQTDLEAKASEADAALSEARADAEAKAAKLCEAEAAVRDAKAGVEEKEKAQREAGTERSVVSEKLSEVKKAIAEHFKPMTAGEDGAGAAHFAALAPLMVGTGVDQSLMSALPTSCVKLPADRTSFDLMAIEQLGRCLEDKAAALNAAVDESAAIAQEHAAAVDAAMAALSAAMASRSKCAEELAASQNAEREAVSAFEAAQAAAAVRGPDLERAISVKEGKEAALENFVGYNLACFEVLRDARSEKVLDFASDDAGAMAAGAGA